MKEKKDKDVKQDEKIEQQEQQNQEQACESEQEAQDLQIDREGMSDEEYIEALEQKLGQAIAEANTCKGLTQRLQADFDNYRKRNNSIAEDMKPMGQSVVIEKMLNVIDN